MIKRRLTTIIFFLFCVTLNICWGDGSYITDVYLSEGKNPLDSLGSSFAENGMVLYRNSISSSRKVSVVYTLYNVKNSQYSATSSISWVTDLKVSYRTTMGAYGNISKNTSGGGWIPGVASSTLTAAYYSGGGSEFYVESNSDMIWLDVSGNILENYTSAIRAFAIKVEFSGLSIPNHWFIISQKGGDIKVRVTLNPNGGTPPVPYVVYDYINGRKTRKL